VRVVDTIASPGPSPSGPNSRIAFGVMVDIETRCGGCENDCAMHLSWLSKKAQERSARVLMLVENAARLTVSAISSVMLRRAFRMTSKVTGSIAGRCSSARPWVRSAIASSSSVAQISISRLPCRSTVTPAPGGTTVVVSICSTIAGPSKRSPARSASRS
jgi:hypothetical protein